jgi:hypothetical protein
MHGHNAELPTLAALQSEAVAATAACLMQVAAGLAVLLAACFPLTSIGQIAAGGFTGFCAKAIQRSLGHWARVPLLRGDHDAIGDW